MNDPLFPLSYSQRMFWLLDRLEPGVPAYNLLRAFGMASIATAARAFAH
jgi:hypothetical protein